MKKSDWAAIILIVAIVGIASYFIVGLILPSPSAEGQEQSVPIAPTISSDVAEPSRNVFSAEAINPTVRTTIGEQSNQQPFDLGNN